MINKLMQLVCDHPESLLSIVRVEYNTEDISCTLVEHRIECSLCGKVIVTEQMFNAVLELLRKVGSL